MYRKPIIITCLTVLMMAVLLSGCSTLTGKPTESSFKSPEVTLSHVEVQTYWGWWFFSNKVKPTKGQPGNYGAPLDLAFIFEIKNPNSFPIKMEKFQFTVGFEEFDLNTVVSTEAMWIPAGKTNEIRMHSISDARQAQLSLLVTGGFKLKQKGKSFWDMLEKWWTGIPEFSFPVSVNEGSAIFKAGDVVKGVTFKATFP